MDKLREEAIKEISKLIYIHEQKLLNYTVPSGLDLSDAILALPSLAAYFRERWLLTHQPEPSGVVAKKNCPFCTDGKLFTGSAMLCQNCNGTRSISRELSNDELCKWAKGIIKYIDKNGPLQMLTLLSPDECLELKEGE